jgi:iron(III) transport system substrate-binding protein
MTSPTSSTTRPALPALVGAVLALGLAAGPVLAQKASPASGGTPDATVPAVSAGAAPVSAEGAITLYTSATQDTVDAVLAALADVHPGLTVEVFRAPTGELDARIASELRSGGIGADVLWVSDPLSLQRYDEDGLLAPLAGGELDAVPAAYRTATAVGTRLLNLVIVAGADVDPRPTAWADLGDPAYAGAVAIPDPGFAGSGFALLGHVASDPELGLDFYQVLKDNGAVQVASPADIVTGVAEGRYMAGVSIDKLVRDTAAQGAPIELVWPEPGAIAVYSPVALLADSDAPDLGRSFIDFLVSREGQAAIASTGWQPVRPDVPWDAPGGPVVAPDWQALFGTQQELLEGYRAIFGE